TVIALGASEFRYYDDAGYYMGCMVGQTIGWAAIMFGYNTRPPDPVLVGDGWRDLWLDRLENTPHYLDHFLSHQREDEYWLRGTVGVDYDAINIPVYAVSGHADCWPNTVPRLLERLSVPRRGLQGAWCHRYPHLGVPGPTVDFLSDAVRWFDQWLKGINTRIMDEDSYQVYIQDSVPPKPFYDQRPGQWVSERMWPSNQVQNRTFHFGNNSLSESASPDSLLKVCSPQTVGLASGEYMPWFVFGPADELPGDQQDEDRGSVVFDTEALLEPLSILGNAQAEITFRCDQSEGLLAVRLCDLWPDGKSTMITRGIVNLCQRESKRHPETLQPGEWYTVTVSLNHTGYKVPSGHTLRLAISTSYWPMAWPTAKVTTVEIQSGSSRLKLPVRSNNAENTNPTNFGVPEIVEPEITTQLRGFSQRRQISVDPESGAYVHEILADNGKLRFHNNQLEMASTTLQRYTIHPDDPLSARAEYEWEWEYSREPNWHIRTFTRTDMTSDEVYFYVKTESVAWEQEHEVFRKQLEKKFKRDYF
ncbi:MAG: CocE/NonD family hydrolase, partial [bacterium]